jgi:putative ABC transport system permease protein
MFFRILKKDLKRKKVMNIILLLFVILSAMFASGSINNMVSVYGGIDYFFEKAGMADYMMLTLNQGGNDPAEATILNAASVTAYEKEDIFFYSSKNLLKDGAVYTEFENPGLVTSINNAKITYFTENNEPVKEIAPGHIMIGGILADPDKTTAGDTVTLELSGVSRDFVIDGYIKDALFGSPFMGNSRMLMNDDDYSYYMSDEQIRDASCGCVYYINTNNIKELKKELSTATNALFAESKATFRMTYMLDMLTAALMLVVSICLILISFAMLSFTIKFTINEDFREIGVMKAVGIRTAAIRSLYLIKYLCIACVGAAIGFGFGLPFAKLMLGSVTKRIVIGNDNNILIGMASAAAVVIIIVAFCYSCTRSIKKLSPVDAVRNGETGERYGKKTFLRLSKSKLPGNIFLALNDVLSRPRQYLSMLITFSLCLLLITMLATTANTLMSRNILFLFGTTESDAYYSSTQRIMETMGSDDPDVLDRLIEDIEEKLKENGMPGKVHVELMYTLPVEFGDVKLQVTMQHCKDTKATEYSYLEGYAPAYPNEIALTPQILDELGASVGDRVLIEINGEKREFIISATFTSFNQMGKVGRLCESLEISPNDASSALSFQIDFDDDPSDETISVRIEEMKKIFDTDKIYDKDAFVEISTGSAKAIGTAKDLVLIIAMVIAALVTVLMERSFISKETPEIALMKALGFKNGSVCARHTLRFVVLMVFATLIASALTVPFTALVSNRIFAVMGALSGIRYRIRPLEIFAVYPLMISAVVTASAFFTSLYIKTIHPDAMGNIE